MYRPKGFTKLIGNCTCCMVTFPLCTYLSGSTITFKIVEGKMKYSQHNFPKRKSFNWNFIDKNTIFFVQIYKNNRGLFVSLLEVGNLFYKVLKNVCVKLFNLLSSNWDVLAAWQIAYFHYSFCCTSLCNGFKRKSTPIQHKKHCVIFKHCSESL